MSIAQGRASVSGHHPACVSVTVPAGFSGWWCARCEKPVNLPEELGSPARCPRCHKPTAVWIPPAEWHAAPPPEPGSHRPKTERAAELFAEMKAAINHTP